MSLMRSTTASSRARKSWHRWRRIVQNAIDLFTQVGLGTPRVALLSAVETVTTKIPSTIDAAALCKMADRGQITGGLVDGPLALSNPLDHYKRFQITLSSPSSGFILAQRTVGFP
jgi:phosphate acetyltransferase